MKNIALLILISFFTLPLFAQLSHEVSGIVKDSTDNTVIGATVTLTSAKDTLKTSTNTDGIFIFKNVQAGQFLISVKSIGYTNYNKRFLYNDATRRLVLDPIILKSETKLLNEVQVNGTPAITYKEDTIEYRASDYKVRENATVDELLKKMEGIEVDKDGTVTAQGTQVTKARLNGRDYSGGDVATAIQNLPADIVEKIQIVDDYGDQAARTGIKDGDPQKVLNIVTKKNRSVGNMARVNAGAGNNDRYGASLFGNRLNGNKQVSTNLSFNNTVTGVAGNNNAGFSGGSFGGGTGGYRSGGNNGGGRARVTVANSAQNYNSGTAGTATSGRGSVGYRDEWGKKLRFNGSYSFNINNNNSENSSSSFNSTNTSELYSTNNGSRDNDTKSHSLNFDLEYEIDSANFIRIQPSLSFNSTLSASNSSTDQVGTLNSAFFHQLYNGGNNSENTSPNFGGTLLYQHIFRKPGRNFSLNLSYNKSDQQRNNDQDIHILYYDTNDQISKDSLVNNLVQRKNLSSTFRQSMTFTERLGTKSRIDFNGQINRRAYNNSAYTDKVVNSETFRVDSLTNVYNYSFTETRLSLNYRFTETRYNFSLGITGIPTVLTGTKVHLGTSTSRNNFFLIPIARFEYQFSRQHRLSFNYTGNASEPTFDQIQPVRDVSTPNNPVVGNPDLKAAFNHIISASYNNFIANSRLNYSLNANYRVVENSVISNRIQYRDQFGGLINETRFLNMDGVSALTANYSISKSLADRKYSIRLNGSVMKRKGVSMSNGIINRSESWTFSQRFGPQINPTEWLELNPNVNFSYSKADYTIEASNNWTRNLALNGDGKIYLQKTLVLSFSASKNYVSGISANVTTNPFIVNSGLEKQFFKRKNGALSIQAFDILKQNNFVSRTLTDNGYVDTKSNALSRYFMLNFRWSPQKWTGAPSRNGRQMMRRGDGSFY